MTNGDHRSTRVVPVNLDSGQRILAEVVVIDPEQPVTALPQSLSACLEAIQEVASTLRSKASSLKPTKTTVEFGVELALDSGKLVALLADGSAKASIKVDLEWSE